MYFLLAYFNSFFNKELFFRFINKCLTEILGCVPPSSHVCDFFINNVFFSTQPQCCLTFSWIELQMLLRCCLIHIRISILRLILYLSIIVPMSRLKFVYVVSFLSIFHFHLYFHHDYSYSLMNTDIQVLLLIFFEYYCIFV